MGYKGPLVRGVSCSEPSPNSIEKNLTPLVELYQNMDTLTKKTVKTARAFTYTYYVYPASSKKPTLLLIHGFPDTSEQWEDLATKHLIPVSR